MHLEGYENEALSTAMDVIAEVEEDFVPLFLKEQIKAEKKAQEAGSSARTGGKTMFWLCCVVAVVVAGVFLKKRLG